MPAGMDSWLNGAGRFFDPAPRVSAVPIVPGEFCIVVDQALANPDGLVGWAAMQDFRPPQGFPYPGVIVDAPPAVSAMVGDYFAQYVRGRLGGRRTLSTTVRLSLVTLSPHELRPVQWQCHRDRLGPAPHDLRLAGMVAYLFRDTELGGTSFYRSLLSDEETERMINDAGRMSAAEFSARYGAVDVGLLELAFARRIPLPGVRHLLRVLEVLLQSGRVRRALQRGDAVGPDREQREEGRPRTARPNCPDVRRLDGARIAVALVSAGHGNRAERLAALEDLRAVRHALVSQHRALRSARRARAQQRARQGNAEQHPCPMCHRPPVVPCTGCPSTKRRRPPLPAPGFRRRSSRR